MLSVWQFGSSMLFFLSALKQVPKSLYEAAKIDGAGPVRSFFKITLPMISPMTLFNLIMQMINAFQEYTAPAVITGGGPVKKTQVLAITLYQNAFTYRKMGYASAISWIMFAIIIVFTIFIFGTRVSGLITEMRRVDNEYKKRKNKEKSTQSNILLRTYFIGICIHLSPALYDIRFF